MTLIRLTLQKPEISADSSGRVKFSLALTSYRMDKCMQFLPLKPVLYKPHGFFWTYRHIFPFHWSPRLDLFEDGAASEGTPIFSREGTAAVTQAFRGPF